MAMSLLRISKNCCLGGQNYFESSGPKKLLKIVNAAINKETDETTGVLGGIGRWPLISTWIIAPSLGRNGPHCMQSLYKMRKFLLNLVPSEPLTLVKELACFDNSI